MPAYLGALTLVLLISMVLTRVGMLKRSGTSALKFGAIDKTDFLIPPFAFLYFYLIFAGAFDWPTFAHVQLFQSGWLQWLGVLFCAAGLILMLLSLISFGTSFRVGIDRERPDALITSGVFAFTRNPIYVAFGFVLAGEFLIQPLSILLIYVVAGFWLFHRQVLREEEFLSAYYGEAWRAYGARVRRYL